MRRSDLPLAEPGLYLIDGPPGDPNGLVISGPYPPTEDGRATADHQAVQAAARMRKQVTVSEVTTIPAPIDVVVPHTPTVTVPRAPSDVVTGEIESPAAADVPLVDIDDADVVGGDAPPPAPAPDVDHWNGGHG